MIGLVLVMVILFNVIFSYIFCVFCVEVGVRCLLYMV